MTVKQFLHSISSQPYERIIGFRTKDRDISDISIKKDKEYVDGTFKYEDWEVFSVYTSDNDIFIVTIREPNATRDGMKNEAVKVMNKRFVELAYDIKNARDRKRFDKVIEKCRKIADELETLQKAIDIL
jgi:hypothetical protein